ncbi:hypothetical protein HHL16_22550 [Pseudoflavitalea sp. G-6-1-2]|uniref:hypothetical protein n=1 Tax=Pseudoflavitalea sp. G-6-1-2 TaxID=2728841 RepID=UPI00146F41ED|nr:hypothetical protein [Pseudoflavitalea sp. G-6-1-2]NML23678.1 hypothetical protein [Pseudoflavitalea sp. G-6-1-2]
MKKPLGLSLLLMLGLIASSFAQVKDASKNLKLQAEKMGAALVKGDFKTFSTYNHPTILQMMGGAPKMIELMNKATSNMKTQGMSFNKVSFGEPSKFVKSGKELQTTIPQLIVMKLAKGRLENASTLIAVSSDNGANWVFIDTSNKDLATIQKFIPSISSSLVIPPTKPPVKYDN